MSDAQTILLILLAFYFFECVKWAPLNACSLVSGWMRRGVWTPRAALVLFYGGKKSMFLAPLIPSVRIFLLSDVVGDAAHQKCSVRTGVGVREQLDELCQQSQRLRVLSLVVFVSYFVYLPVVYRYYGEGSYLYAGVAIGYLSQAFVALAYYSLHRKRYPKERGRRYLHTLYSMLLPWHAMRASDEFFIEAAKDWSEIAQLGAFAQRGAARERLLFYWRQAKYVKSPLYSTVTLAPLLREVKISEGQAMAVEKPVLGGKYCPCCGVHYQASAMHCVDCRGVHLAVA